MKIVVLRIIDKWLEADVPPRLSESVRLRFAGCCAALGVSTDLAKRLTQSNFRQSVSRLRARKREASWRLGEALLKAGEFEDAGDNRSAIQVLERFIKVSRAVAYIELAQNEVKRIRKKLQQPPKR